MAHSSIEYSLRTRRDEIDEALRPFQVLIEERERIEGLLAFYKTSTDTTAQSSEASTKGTRAPSKVGRLLTRSREVLKGHVAHEMTFLELFQNMPQDLLGEGRHVREHFRGMLQRSGAKFGIEYVSSEAVRLTEPSP